MRPLLNDKEAAVVLGVGLSTLQRWRVTCDGPPFVKMGRTVRYRPEDIDQYVAVRVKRG